MRTLATRLPTALLCLLAAGAAAEDKSPLAPLAHWVGGEWVGHFDAGNGRRFTTIRRYEWAFDGRLLIGRSYGERDGKRVQTRETIYHWNPESKRIEFEDHIDGGGHGAGFVEPRDGALYMEARIVGNPKHPAWRAVVQDDGADAQTIKVQALRDGAWGDFGSYPYRRR